MGIAEPGHCEHVTRRAAQPVDAHGRPPLDPPEQRILEEAGKALRAVEVLIAGKTKKTLHIANIAA